MFEYRSHFIELGGDQILYEYLGMIERQSSIEKGAIMEESGLVGYLGGSTGDARSESGREPFRKDKDLIARSAEKSTKGSPADRFYGPLDILQFHLLPFYGKFSEIFSVAAREQPYLRSNGTGKYSASIA